MKRNTILRLLRDAQRDTAPIRLYSRAKTKTRYIGYVVGLNEDFVLLHFIDDNLRCFDGYYILPLADIRTARRSDDNDNILHRALQVKGLTPAAPRGIVLDDFPAMLASIDTHFPLTVLHLNYRYPGACFVGRAAQVKKRSVRLREIDPAAYWKRVRKYRYRDLTAVSFGAGYEDSLWRVSEQARRAAEPRAENES